MKSSMQEIIPEKRVRPLVSALALMAILGIRASAGLAFEPRITNGRPTSDFPAMAAVGLCFSESVVGLCSGTLIAPAVVLTAAHCFDLNPIRVVAVFVVNGEFVPYPVDSFVIPRAHVVGSSNADIALLKLATAVEGITPMPLARVRPRAGRFGTIVGFGEDNLGQVGVKEMGTVKLGRCTARLTKRYGVRTTATALCWQPSQGGSNVCEGDSGGPLVVDGKVAGVTSTGCGPDPNIDTSVAAFRAWIERRL